MAALDAIDQILFPILKQIGCKLPDNVTSISGFESDLLYHASAMMLKAINRDSDLPTELPASQATRFRFATNLALAVKELGMTGEFGYQAILYPSEQETRKLLVFLLEKLPKQKEEEEEEALGADAVTSRRVMDSLRVWIEEAWHPLRHAKKTDPVVSCPLTWPSADPAEVAEYVATAQPVLSSQPPKKKLLPASVFELNVIDIELAAEQERDRELDAGVIEARRQTLNNLISQSFQSHIAKIREENSARANFEMGSLSSYTGSAFQNRTYFEQEGGAAQMKTDKGVVVVSESGEIVAGQSEDAVREARERELQILQDQLKTLQDKLKKMEDGTERSVSQSRQIESDLNSLNSEIKELENAYKLKKKTLDLLPNAEKNLEELTKLSADNSKALLELNQNWEKRRLPEVLKYRKNKQLLEQRKGDVARKVREIKVMRKDMKDKAVAVRERDQIYKQLAEELSKLPKSINRQVYVRRIMDIVKNLDQQKADIKKHLTDVRRVQKEINQVSKTEERSFAVANEVVYQAAVADRADPFGTQSYKSVVTMRDGFHALLDKVRDTGKCKNDISDISQQVQALEARNTSLNMKRVETDLDQVKKENKALAAKLKALKEKYSGSE